MFNMKYIIFNNVNEIILLKKNIKRKKYNQDDYVITDGYNTVKNIGTKLSYKEMLDFVKRNKTVIILNEGLDIDISTLHRDNLFRVLKTFKYNINYQYKFNFIHINIVKWIQQIPYRIVNLNFCFNSVFHNIFNKISKKNCRIIPSEFIYIDCIYEYLNKKKRKDFDANNIKDINLNQKKYIDSNKSYNAIFNTIKGIKSSAITDVNKKDKNVIVSDKNNANYILFIDIKGNILTMLVFYQGCIISSRRVDCVNTHNVRLINISNDTLNGLNQYIKNEILLIVYFIQEFNITKSQCCDNSIEKIDLISTFDMDFVDFQFNYVVIDENLDLSYLVMAKIQEDKYLKKFTNLNESWFKNFFNCYLFYNKHFYIYFKFLFIMCFVLFSVIFLNFSYDILQLEKEINSKKLHHISCCDLVLFNNRDLLKFDYVNHLDLLNNIFEGSLKEIADFGFAVRMFYFIDAYIFIIVELKQDVNVKKNEVKNAHDLYAYKNTFDKCFLSCDSLVSECFANIFLKESNVNALENYEYIKFDEITLASDMDFCKFFNEKFFQDEIKENEKNAKSDLQIDSCMAKKIKHLDKARSAKKYICIKAKINE